MYHRKCFVLITLLCLYGCDLDAADADANELEHQNVAASSITGIDFSQMLSCDSVDIQDDRFSNIVSAFGSYCNEQTLFWFHRLIYSQTFGATKIPKYIFIFIHNLGDSEHCVDGMNHQRYYLIFAQWIEVYFQHKLKIFVSFDDTLHSAAFTRNFLINQVNGYFTHNVSASVSKQLQLNGRLVLSLFDADDVFHPQRLEILEFLFSSFNINGTVLHGYTSPKCRDYADKELFASFYQTLFAHLNGHTSDSNVDDIYAQMTVFHLHQNDLLRTMVSFQSLDIHNPPLVPQIYAVQHEHDVVLVRDTHYLYVWMLWKQMCGMYVANGWPTGTLESLVNSQYDTTVAYGEDSLRNKQSVDVGYQLVLVPIKLGAFCSGGVQFKPRGAEI